MKITIFYIPCSDENAATSLSQSAIASHLAACANILPAKSLYPWNGELQHDNESILLLKTTTKLKDTLAGFIASNHPYELPCIMHWDVEVNEKYGNWIAECVSKKS